MPARTARLVVRISAEERQRMQLAALAAERTLSDWARRALVAQAEQEQQRKQARRE